MWPQLRLLFGVLITLKVHVYAEVYGHDGEILKPDTEECMSCAFAAIRAKDKFDNGGDENNFMSVNDWINVLEEGCHGDKACPSLIRKYGKAMGGALVDFVQDGDDAEEKGADISEFQAAICHKYALVCKAGYGFPTVRQVTFKVPIDAGVDVGLFKRGSVQSGDQPMKPDLVLAPGQQHTFYPSQTMSLKENFAFRFMPVEDISCPGEGSISPDESKCLISCGTKKSASCRNAEKICKKYKNKCDTIALDKSSKNGYLKSIAIEWHSPMLLDLFLSSDLYQEYEITSHPNFNPLLPLKVPNMKIPKPEAWDEEEDGEWAPPLMDNTEKLKNNPRFIAYDKNTAGERAGQVAHKGGPIKKENKMRNTDDKNYNHNNNNEDIKANDDEQPGKKKKKQSSKSKRSSKSSEEL